MTTKHNKYLPFSSHNFSLFTIPSSLSPLFSKLFTLHSSLLIFPSSLFSKFFTFRSSFFTIPSSLLTIIFLLTFSFSLLQAGTLTRDSNGIVTDSSTNLMWQDDITSVSKAWNDAIAYCEALNLGGYNDWRLPNINELLSIIDISKINPAIKENIFTHITSSNYWSSSIGVSGTSNAWYVYFYNGYTGSNTKSNSSYVRCTRGGQ